MKKLFLYLAIATLPVLASAQVYNTDTNMYMIGRGVFYGLNVDAYFTNLTVSGTMNRTGPATFSGALTAGTAVVTGTLTAGARAAVVGSSATTMDLIQHGIKYSGAEVAGTATQVFPVVYTSLPNVVLTPMMTSTNQPKLAVTVYTNRFTFDSLNTGITNVQWIAIGAKP